MEVKDILEDKIFIPKKEIRFIVEISCERQTAEFLWAKEGSEGEYYFKIRFSDGHEDLYQLDNQEVYSLVHKGQRYEMDRYTNALCTEIYGPLWAYEPEDLIYIFFDEETGYNIWAVLHKSDPCYTVYIGNEIVGKIPSGIFSEKNVRKFLK